MKKLRAKLISAFLCVIALMLVLNVIFLALHFKMLRDYRKTTDNMLLEYKVIETTDKLIQLHYVLVKSASSELLQEYNRLHGEIDAIFLQLDQDVIYKESRFMYRGLKNVIRNIIADCDSGLEYILAGNVVKSLEVYAEVQRKNYFVKDNFASFILKELEYASILQGRYKKTHLLILVSIMLFTVVLTLGCIVFVFIFSKKLTNPLVRLTNLALDITGGNLTTKVEKDLLEKRDEIGILAISFNSMLVNLKNRIDLERTRVNEIKKQHVVLQEFSKTEFPDLDDALRKIIKVDAATLDVERVNVWFFDQARAKIICVGGYILSENKYETGGEILLKNYPRYFGALEEMMVIQADDVSVCEETQELKEAYFDKLGIVSLMDAAIRSHGKTIGVICHEHVGQRRSWSQEELEFVSSVADRISLIIEWLERKRVEDELQVAYNKLRQSQEELVQSAKFKAIGQLASSVAHEVRNPLAIILQSIDYLRERVPDQHREVIQVAANNIKRANTIIGTLMDFSKVKALSMAQEDVNSIIEDSLALTRYSNHEDKIKVVKELSDNLPKILVDRQKIVQVMINILLNAIQAISGEGNIFVRTYLAEFNQRQGVPSEEKTESQFSLKQGVVIEVEDEGVGISEENMNNLFRPFFTTKETMTGIGLGLSVVKEIILMHNGKIDIKSRLDHGTKVTITLGIGGGV